METGCFVLGYAGARFVIGVSKEEKSKSSNCAVEAFCGVPKSKSSKSSEVGAWVDAEAVVGVNVTDADFMGGCGV